MRIRTINPEKTSRSAVVGAAALATALLGFIPQPARAQSSKGTEPAQKEASKAERAPKAPSNESNYWTQRPANSPQNIPPDTEKTVNDPAQAANGSARQGAVDTKQTGRDADSSHKDVEYDADRAKAIRRDAARQPDEAKQAPDADRTPRDSAVDGDQGHPGAALHHRSSKTVDDRRGGDERRENNSRTADDRRKSRENTGLSFSDKSRDRLTVLDVVRNGPAASTGFRQGDIIVSFDGLRVNSQSDFNRWFLGARSRLPIVVLRDGRQTTLYSDYVADATRSNRAYLGVMFDLRNSPEVRILQVNRNSPAEAAGLRNGSVILGINGQRIASPEDLVNEIGKLSPGDEARLEIAVGGTTDTVAVTLGSRPGISAQQYEVAKPPIGSADQRLTPPRAENGSVDEGTSAPRGPLPERIFDNR